MCENTNTSKPDMGISDGGIFLDKGISGGSPLGQMADREREQFRKKAYADAQRPKTEGRPYSHPPTQWELSARIEKMRHEIGMMETLQHLLSLEAPTLPQTVQGLQLLRTLGYNI